MDGWFYGVPCPGNKQGALYLLAELSVWLFRLFLPLSNQQHCNKTFILGMLSLNVSSILHSLHFIGSNNVNFWHCFFQWHFESEARFITDFLRDTFIGFFLLSSVCTCGIIKTGKCLGHFIWAFQSVLLTFSCMKSVFSLYWGRGGIRNLPGYFWFWFRGFDRRR